MNTAAVDQPGTATGSGGALSSPRAPAIAAILFLAPVAMTFAVAPGAWWADYPGILFHLSLFLLVPLLPAPDWAKAALLRHYRLPRLRRQGISL